MNIRLRLAEIALALVGAALIWSVPWTGLFPIVGAITWTNWATQAQSLAVIEIITALLVMPLFAILFRLWRVLGWRSLLAVFVTSVALFTAGDLLIIWLRSEPVTSNANGVVNLQLAWIFATLLFSPVIARRLAPSDTALSA